MSVPYIGFGNDQLENQPNMIEGMDIICPHCGSIHQVILATKSETGEKSNMLGGYKCGDKSYLAGVNGKLVIGLKSACSGEI